MERINTAAARAINALPAEEAAQFDEVLSEDSYLRAHTDSFRRVSVELVDALPEIVPAASPVIWERIVDETGIGHAFAENQPQVIAPPKRGRGLLLSFAAVAAALVVGVAVGSTVLDSQSSLSDLSAAAVADGAATVELTDPVDGATVAASAVVDADGNGYLTAVSLPALSDDRTYQLWVIVGDEIVSAGLLGNDPDISTFRAEGEIVGMAISNEAAGGVAVSENEPVALWLQDA